MATSRRTGTNEHIGTYDSAGGKDYTSLSTWETTTDVDLTAGGIGQSEVLECYKGVHDDIINVQGATTDASFFRIIRPAPGEIHSGIPKSDGTCVEFHNTGATYVFRINESFFQLQDLVLKSLAVGGTNNVINLSEADISLIGLLIYDSVLATINRAISVTPGGGNSAYIINCLIHNVKTRGVFCSTGTTYLYNLTENDGGSLALEIQAPATCNSKNCVLDGPIFNDGVHNQTTNTLNTPIYRGISSDNFHLHKTDTVARGNGTDLSADGDFAFDDDIDLETRSAWDIGFDEFSAVPPKSSSGGRLELELSRKLKS
jgi:hypothetical protein